MAVGVIHFKVDWNGNLDSMRSLRKPPITLNVGLDLGYYFGTNDVGGFAAGLEIVVGLIP